MKEKTSEEDVQLREEGREDLLTTEDGTVISAVADIDSGIAEIGKHRTVSDDVHGAEPRDGDASLLNARKNERAMAAEKRRADVEARKLERENVSLVLRQ